MIRGVVTASGGGYVTVLVDRDVESYPEGRVIVTEEPDGGPGGLVPVAEPRSYPSDDYPGLAALASNNTRVTSHVQIVLEASKALNEIAGLRQDLAEARRRG